MRRGWRSVLLLMSMIALSWARAEAGLNVVATTEHSAAIVKIVGGDRLAVAYLGRGDQDPRAIEPKSSFLVSLNRADLLIVNGQGLEAAWLPTVLSDSTNARLREGKPGYLDASQGAKLLPYDPKEVESPFPVKALVALNAVFGKGSEDLRLGNNPYYWLDPANGEAIARTMSERLALLDLSNAEFYHANYERFASRLRERLRAWDAVMKSFEGMEIVSYRRSWTYLARRHGLKVLDYVEPKEPLVLGPTNLYNPPDRDEKSLLIAKMRQNHIKLLVAETYQDQALRETAHAACFGQSTRRHRRLLPAVRAHLSGAFPSAESIR
jgi:ABC-type Zn uptake system ZnuABC Zn-binding protein ZnuA